MKAGRNVRFTPNGLSVISWQGDFPAEIFRGALGETGDYAKAARARHGGCEFRKADKMPSTLDNRVSTSNVSVIFVGTNFLLWPAQRGQAVVRFVAFDASARLKGLIAET